MLIAVILQEAFPWTMDKGTRRDHFCIKERMFRNTAPEVAEMAVGALHHRRDAYWVSGNHECPLPAIGPFVNGSPRGKVMLEAPCDASHFG